MELNDDNRKKYEKLCRMCEGDFEAYLYDCDGTLADNMPAHRAAFVKVARANGLDNLDASIVDELAGWPTVDVVAEINRRYHTDFDPEAFAREKSVAFFESIDDTRPIEFVAAHLMAAAPHKKIGVVSGGRHTTVNRTLTVLNLLPMVGVIVCAGDTEKGKPSPEPFLLAAEKLGIPAEKCIVFEDGDAGIQGALAAGMRAIRVDKI